MNNINLFLKINGLTLHSHALNALIILIAKYGAYAIPLFLLYLWFEKSENSERKLTSLFLFTSVIISLLLSFTLSKVHFSPRPFMVGLGTQRLHHAPDASFPSDHATVLTAIAVCLFFLRETVPAFAFLILDFAVSFARIYCGIHFPYDIFGGFMAGLTGSNLVWALRDWFSPTFQGIIALYGKIFSKYSRNPH